MKWIVSAILLAVVLCTPSRGKAAECIPVYHHSLSPSGNADRSLNDALFRTLTAMTPIYLYLELALTDEQVKDISRGPDDRNRINFFVKGNDWQAEYLIHLKKGQKDFGFSAKNKSLSGFFVVSDVAGPNTGVMSVILKPFSPTIKKCY